MSLLQSIEKPYVFTFYVFVKFFTDEWRAVVVMTVFQAILIGGLVCGVALVTGHAPVLIPKSVLIIGGLAVYALTQFVLIRKQRWLRYKPEFERYSNTKRTTASIAVWTGLVLTSLAGIALIKAAIH
jgi:hypothetical protein